MHTFRMFALAALASATILPAQDVSVPAASLVRRAVQDPELSGRSGAGHALILFNLGRFDFVEGGLFAQDRAAGSAQLTGRAVEMGNAQRGFDVDARFRDLTFVKPTGSPKTELLASAYKTNGGPVDPATWYYYTTTEGVLRGFGDYAGAEIHFWRDGPAFQVGVGANGKNGLYGASGWLEYCTITQPSSGRIHLPGQDKGDFNIDLEGECLCVEGAAGVRPFWANTRDDAFSIPNLGCGGSPWDFVSPAVYERDATTGAIRLTGELVNRADPNCRLCVQIDFDGIVRNGDPSFPPSGSPVVSFDSTFLRSNGGVIDPTQWVYSTSFTGTLVGKAGLEGAQLSIARRGAAAQFGPGASRNTRLGTSGWIRVTVDRQPNNGPHLTDANGDFDLSLAVCDAPVFATPVGPIASLPTITQDCFRLTGAGLDLVTEVTFGNQTIRSTDPCDFGRGWFEVEGDCGLCVYPPFCLPAGTYDVTARTANGVASNTIEVEIVDPTAPTLVCPAEFPVDKPFSVWLHQGDVPNAVLFTIYTPIGEPFIIPGIVELGVAGSNGIYVCGPPLNGPCAEDFFGPIPVAFVGRRVYFQGIAIDFNRFRFPLRTTNVCTTDFVGARGNDNLVDVGGFEGNPPVPTNGLVNYEEDDTIYGAWRVAAGEVDVHHNTNNGGQGAFAEGDQHLDLNGDEAGTVEQDVDGLTPGVQYTLSFRYARHKNAGGSNTARVRIAGLDQTFATNVSGASAWQNASFTFTANRTTHTLRFDSLDSSSTGMLVDDVQIRRR